VTGPSRSFCPPQRSATFKGKRIFWLPRCLRVPSKICFLHRALENCSRFRQRRRRFPVLTIASDDPDNVRSSLVTPCFSKLTLGFPIAKKSRMSSFSATLSVILKSCSASDCQLKRVYTERIVVFSCDHHKSSTVNPEGRFKSTPPSPHEVSPGRCCLSGGSPNPA